MAKDKKRTGRIGWTAWIAAAAALLFGLALLIWPGITLDLILNVAGTVLIVIGVVNLIRYFVNREPYDLFSWSLGLGLALVSCGVALIAFKKLLLSIVPLMFGFALLIGGIIKIQAGSNMHRIGYARWYLTLIGAGVSCVLGLLIILHPFGTGLTLMRVLGASIALEGVQDLLSARSYNKVVTTYFVD